jgi:hypothetical protein
MKLISLISILLVAGTSILGCSVPHHATLAGTKTYHVAHRQLAPDPVYNRLRWVHLPEMYPSMLYKADEERPRYFPVYHFSIKNRPLCHAASQLAGTARYSSYCSSILRSEKITVETLGTIDEIAEAIEAANAIVRVIVDHENREVRFLTNSVMEGQFFVEPEVQ